MSNPQTITKPPRGALDLLEEAVHLLRQAPSRVWMQYFAGAAPFLLGLLYFWADMSSGPFAHTYLAESAFGLVLLYIWMKCWQSVFCTSIHSRLMEQIPPRFTLRRVCNLIGVQTILQPYSLFVLPVSSLGFGWAFAFFQNILVLGNGDHFDLKRVVKFAWRQAALWPLQNHRALFVLLLFSLILFLNVAILLIAIPSLAKTLFGIETIFTMSGFQLLNTTFFSIVCAITYLCLDPVICVVYTLRCFYGESIESGADLIAELKGLQVREKLLT